MALIIYSGAIAAAHRKSKRRKSTKKSEEVKLDPDGMKNLILKSGKINTLNGLKMVYVEVVVLHLVKKRESVMNVDGHKLNENLPYNMYGRFKN